MASPYAKNRVDIDGKSMAYVEVGEGDPIVFLHGNPTSSYLWRDVMPPLEGLGRCVAPDLIGMGDSEKLDDAGPDSYRFVEHRNYLDRLLETLEINENVTLVLHDWGSALGFDWANRHRSAVRAIAYMEAIVMPIAWADFPEPVAPVFQAFRSDQGESLILEQNMFVEQVLPGAIIRKLSEDEMNEYRRPFAEPGEGRRPTLSWPRQIPIEGDPADVCELVSAYAEWLEGSQIPKLLVGAEPGALLRGKTLDYCRTWPNQKEVSVAGVHFIQEDSGAEIGGHIAEWLTGLSS